jgi:hypothetical protein
VARRKQRELWASTPGGRFTTNIFSFVELTSYHHGHQGGPAIDVYNSDGGRCQTHHQHPPGGPPSTSPTLVVATTRPTASTPQGGPPSTSPTSVVAAVGPATSTPRGAHHRHLQLRWWPLTDLPPTPPKGPAIDISLNLVPVTRIFLATPTRGATVVNITTISKKFGGKWRQEFGGKKIGSLRCKNPGVIIPLQK